MDLGDIAIRCVTCALIGLIIIWHFVHSSSIDESPSVWIGAIPETNVNKSAVGPCDHPPAECPQFDVVNSAIWQLSGQAAVSSRTSSEVTRGPNLEIKSTGGTLTQEGLECPHAITSWTLGAIRDNTVVDKAPATIVRQGQLTNTSKPVGLDSFPIPAGTHWVALTFKRLDTSPCPVRITWQEPRLKPWDVVE